METHGKKRKRESVLEQERSKDGIVNVWKVTSVRYYEQKMGEQGRRKMRGNMGKIKGNWRTCKAFNLKIP